VALHERFPLAKISRWTEGRSLQTHVRRCCLIRPACFIIRRACLGESRLKSPPSANVGSGGCASGKRDMKLASLRSTDRRTNMLADDRDLLRMVDGAAPVRDRRVIFLSAAKNVAMCMGAS
jgi:hypothetical protein